MKMKISSTVVCCILLILVDARSIKSDERTEVTTCSKSTPCGWQVYTPYDRVNEYFVSSPCECSTGTKCKQWRDDISISAYVFRCM